MVTAVGVKFVFVDGNRFGVGSFAPSAAAIDGSSPLARLNESLRRGDPRALVFVHERVMPKADGARQAVGDQEAKDWLETLAALRAGFPTFAGPGRATAVSIASRILEKFGVEPAAAQWVETLRPVHDVLSASLADADPTPRCAALSEISRFWSLVSGPIAHPV